MRIAVCASDMDARYELSRLVDKALLLRGFPAEMSLFPTLAELLEVTAEGKSIFELVFVSNARDAAALKTICRRAHVILVGGKDAGPAAFDIGARYFIEAPVNRDELDRALTRCLSVRKKETVI